MLRALIGLLVVNICVPLPTLAADLETFRVFQERPANFAISSTGRIFFTKLALGGLKGGVIELHHDKSISPFPDFNRNVRLRSNGMPIENAIGIKAVDDTLYVLDMGNSKLGKNAKLVSWSISSGEILSIHYVPSDVLRPNSFLQGFVVDRNKSVAVIADMTDPMGGDRGPLPVNPAFVVLDLKNGLATRILENDPSFLSSARSVKVGNRTIMHRPKLGKAFAPVFPLNPIAISPDSHWVYFGAMGGTKVYRISLQSIISLSNGYQLKESHIEYYCDKPQSDGFDIDASGNIYVGDINDYSIKRVSPSGSVTLAKDDQRLEWPDSVTISEDGYVYTLAHAINRDAAFNGGIELPLSKFYFTRIKIADR